jgi:hypothetical protein
VDQCWAVGTLNEQGDVNKPLIEGYHGTGWTIVSGIPNDNSQAAVALRNLSCVTATDCWAVGSEDGTGVILQWQGSDWTSVVPTPYAGIDLVGVSCLGPSYCWAVGAALLHP